MVAGIAIRTIEIGGLELFPKQACENRMRANYRERSRIAVFSERLPNKF
jgi:hypothetical protein